MDDTDDVLDAAHGIVDRHAGVLLFDDSGAGLLQGQAGWEREDAAARGHDLTDDDVAELDGAVDDLFLKGGQQTHAARGGGDQLEFIGRVDLTLATQGRLEEPEDEGGGSVHQSHAGAGHTDEDIHGAGDGEGDAFGALQSEGLGDEFSKEDFKVGDDAEGDDDCGGVGVDADVRRDRGKKAVSEVVERGGDGGLADPAEGEAGEGYAELDGGKEVVHVVLELEDGAGAGSALGDELLDAGLADADESELGCDEEAVGQDEEGHHDSSNEGPLKHKRMLAGTTKAPRLQGLREFEGQMLRLRRRRRPSRWPIRCCSWGRRPRSARRPCRS